MRRPKEYLCLCCGKQFVSVEKAPKFCNHSCACKFSAVGRRRPTNEQISAGLRKFWQDDPQRTEHAEQIKQRGIKSQQGKHKRNPSSLLELSKRTVEKIVRRLHLGCAKCGWAEEVGDIHHIVPKAEGGTDDHHNLIYLCPNHHRLAQRKKLDLTNLPRLTEHIGDKWLQVYYG